MLFDNKVKMGNKDYFCPLLEQEIYDGLCWEICFANIALKLEAIPELKYFLSNSNKHKTVKDAHKVCDKCIHCQWTRE